MDKLKIIRYGIPYQGSKNKIANWVIDNIPSCDTFVDLFAGGCAVTHAAMLSGKWNNFIANDIIEEAPQLFKNATEGKFVVDKRWISREEFKRLRESDFLISICWSYGNNRRDYLYSKEIEPWKKALHYAKAFNDFSLFQQMGIETDGTRADIVAHKEEYREKYIKWLLQRQNHFADASKIYEIRTRSLQKLQDLQNLERLQSLGRMHELESLERIESLEHLQIYGKDYQQVNIPQNAIVYCDPPYKKTRCTGYKSEFDYNRFEEWLNKIPFMVIVSEYTAPKDCVEIASVKKHQTMGTSNKGGTQTEKLFVQERFYDEYCKNIGKIKG